MKQCRAIGCVSVAIYDEEEDFCPKCSAKLDVALWDGKETYIYKAPDPYQTSVGGDNDYWLLTISNPKRLEPYVVEAEDVIEALSMTFQEGEAYKAIFRKCKARMGQGKPGDTALRNAQKVAYYGNRMVAMEERELKCET